VRVHGMNDHKEVNRIVERCLREASLWNEVKKRLQEPTSRLSVGQQQRLCVTRALAVKPEVLLCNEATSALNPIPAREIEKRLLALKQDYTVVFVTHVLRHVRRLADYVFLYLGDLVEHGLATEVFMHPSDQRTKAYVEGVFS
jgi:phosphate transport system ATP-binding protein